jgi:iron complex transport system ATP-binding protein
VSIIIDRLSFAYGRLTALDEVCAAAAPGRMTAIIGPNAAGKTTLLRCMIGALVPQRGAVLIDGAAAHRLHPRRLAERIAYLSQRPVLAAAFRVREVVQLGRFALPPDPHRVDDALHRMDLADLADRPYPQLSVGQQQRVMMARALAQLGCDGHLLMDEPLSGLDQRHTRECISIWRDLAARGATVVLTLHDIALAAAVADDVWLMVDRKLLAAGPSRAVMSVDRLRSAFGVDFAWMTDQTGAWLVPSGMALRPEEPTIEPP